MKYKHSLSEMEAWKTVDFQKRGRGRPVDLKRVQLPSLYEAAREISKAKFHAGLARAMKRNNQCPKIWRLYGVVFREAWN